MRDIGAYFYCAKNQTNKLEVSQTLAVSPLPLSTFSVPGYDDVCQYLFTDSHRHFLCLGLSEEGCQ